MKLFALLYQNLTCCREQYQAAKSSRWEHKGFLHRHNHLDSTSVYSRSISWEENKWGGWSRSYFIFHWPDQPTRWWSSPGSSGQHRSAGTASGPAWLWGSLWSLEQVLSTCCSHGAGRHTVSWRGGCSHILDRAYVSIYHITDITLYWYIIRHTATTWYVISKMLQQSGTNLVTLLVECLSVTVSDVRLI